jgi:hypothetical protein
MTTTPPTAPNLVVELGVARTSTTFEMSYQIDPTLVGGDLQDAYDRGVSSPDVTLDPGASINFQNSGLNTLFKVDSPSGGIITNSILSDGGAPLSIKVGAQGLDLDAEGDVGVGTDSPTGTLDIRQRSSSEPALVTSGTPGATADLAQFLAAADPTPRVRITSSGNLIFDDAQLVNAALSAPPIQSSTPQGALWMANSFPVNDYLPNTLHVFDGVEWSPVGQAEDEGIGAYFVTDTFSPTLGQTAFSLSAEPTTTNGLIFAVVDSGVYYKDVSFTTTGTSFTWLDVPFSLGPPDDLLVYYQVGADPAPTQMVQEVFTTTTPGETGFVLSFEPQNRGWIFVFVNGIEYDETTHWTRFGQNVVWLDNPSPLPVGARVTVNYQR